MKFLVPLVFALCLAGSAVLGQPMHVARAETGDAYPFSCSQNSLTADFADRDALPQTQVPVAEWYRTNSDGHYVNHGWGPAANALPPPVIPAGAGCDAGIWKRERILAVAMRYINAPGNALGLQYRHHHIPGWDPPSSTDTAAPQGNSEENPDADAPRSPTAWAAGRGLDCSNFTAWVYNYGLGIKFDGDVHHQYEGTAGPMGSRVPKDGPFQPGDLLYLHPNGSETEASHVVVYVDDQRIIDSRVNAQNIAGVQVRMRLGWYRHAVLAAWRPIG